MPLPQIVREILAKTATESLDVAGLAVVGPFWPFIKGPLSPVIDKLEARIRGDGSTSPTERVRLAEEAFEADQHLQQQLRSSLIEGFDKVIAGQEQISASLAVLMADASGNHDLLNQISSGISRIEDRQGAAVAPDDEWIDRVARRISEQAQGQRQVRAIALRATGPVADLMERQLHRLQIRAVELVREEQPERALDELEEGQQLVAALLNEAPSDLIAQTQLGFIFKTFAQVYDELGQVDESTLYTNRADEIFRQVARDAEQALDMSNALVGEGNAAQSRGEYAQAIAFYRRANVLAPDNYYALHDLLTVYLALADNGQTHLDEMRDSLSQLTQLNLAGKDGFDVKYLARLKAAVQHYEAAAAT
jgi:tetratricopeptide (TPR) repeat protein